MTLVGLHLERQQQTSEVIWQIGGCSSAIAKMAIYYDFQPHLH